MNTSQAFEELFGAVEARLATIKIRLIPSDEIEYKHYLAALEAALDTPVLAAARAEGRAMTLEQAMEFALQT